MNSATISISNFKLLKSKNFFNKAIIIKVLQLKLLKNW